MFHQFCGSNTDTFVFGTRNPLERINSWYYFEKHNDSRPRRELLWKECYENSFEELVIEGLGHDFSNDTIPVDIVNMTCPQRALAMVLGVRMVDYSNHVSCCQKK